VELRYAGHPPTITDPRAAVVVMGPPDGERFDDFAALAEAEAELDAVAARGWARRILYRPHPDDTDDDLLDALTILLAADRVGIVESGPAGDGIRIDGPEISIRSGAGWIAISWDRAPPDPRTALDLARVAAMVRERRSEVRQVKQLKSENRLTRELVGRLLDLLAHDLRNALFPLQLAVRVLERQHAGDPQLGAIHRASRAALDLMQRAAEAGGALVEGGSESKGRADLLTITATAVSSLRAVRPQRLIEAELPPIEVDVSAPAMERLVVALLTNAVVHGTAGEPVRIRGAVDDGRVQMTFQNAGSLPFDDLRTLQPFRHRGEGGFGLGLVLARRIAEIHGVELFVESRDGLVTAMLKMPGRYASTSSGS